MTRVGLLVLGVSYAATGTWALLAPHSWWASFPGFGRHWMSVLGPFNDELVRDFGALYLVLAALLLWAAVILARRAVQAAAGAVLLFVVLHTTYIIGKLHLLPAADRVGLMAGLAFTAVLSAAILKPAHKLEA